jgi:hypothetical protein
MGDISFRGVLVVKPAAFVVKTVRVGAAWRAVAPGSPTSGAAL